MRILRFLLPTRWRPTSSASSPSTPRNARSYRCWRYQSVWRFSRCRLLLAGVRSRVLHHPSLFGTQGLYLRPLRRKPSATAPGFWPPSYGNSALSSKIWLGFLRRFGPSSTVDQKDWKSKTICLSWVSYIPQGNSRPNHQGKPSCSSSCGCSWQCVLSLDS